MATKLNEVKLPEWVWVSGGEHERNGNPLENRMIIMHVHTATIIEMFNDGDFIPNGGVFVKRFSYVNMFDITEKHIAAVHSSALKLVSDPDDYIDEVSEIVDAGIEWYKSYLKWEDGNISSNELANLN